MPESFAAAIGAGGFWVIVAGAVLAGLVRGFSGFGTALVYLPVAARFLTPFEALTTLIIMDLIAPLMHVPRALREGQPGDVLRLVAGAAFAVPLGVFVLSLVHPDVFRWTVSVIALGLLVLLALGVRYRGRLTRPMIFGTGALGGFLSGAAGLPGPPVIMLYMASTLPARAIRANLTLYLLLSDVLLFGVLWWNGYLVASAVALGILVILPYLLGNWLGAALFRPGGERIYRWAAYAIIAGSAIMGLPVWD